MATFRQTTSRADDPQLHTHAVDLEQGADTDGRWLALDARYMKKYQRMLGGIYQSVLRNELTHRFGFEWETDRERPGRDRRHPEGLLRGVLEAHVADRGRARRKLDEFRNREGRDPTSGSGPRSPVRQPSTRATRRRATVSPIWRHGGARPKHSVDGHDLVDGERGRRSRSAPSRRHE